MNFARFPRTLLLILIASVTLNIWQFIRSEPAIEDTARGPVAKRLSRPESITSPLSGKKPDALPPRDGEVETERQAESIAARVPPEKRSEDDLIFGDSGIGGGTPVHGELTGKVSPERLKELAGMPVSQAGRFRVHARLLLPGDRVFDVGISEFAAGQRIKFERINEFPFPTSVEFARVEATSPFASGGGSSSPGQGSFPITPTTPAEFEFKTRGLEIELDLTPAPGSLVVGGSVKQTVFEGFARMPGEAFSSVWQDDVIFSDNKVLQPQFTTRESPFVAAATAGQPIRIPVHTSFGQTFLEITCTPLE